jgi:hypothetical protein
MGRAGVIMFLSALMLGCSGLDVKRDFDASVDFQRLKIYAWQSPMETVAGDALANNSLIDGRIRKAVNAVLSEKGYESGFGSDPDCRIAYLYAVVKAPEPDHVRTGIGLGMGSGGAFGSLGIGLGSGARDAEQETLTIDVLDPRNGKLLWRGVTQQDLERSSDPKKSAASINAMVRAILSKFPPQTANQ